jgi:hypothetical protein
MVDISDLPKPQKSDISDLPIPGQKEELSPDRTTFAETDGGAALGRPGLKMAKVKEITPLEAFGVGAISRPASTAIGATQLATGGRLGTETAQKQAAELKRYKQQYPIATGAGEIAGDIGEFLALGGGGKAVGALKGAEGTLARRVAEQATVGGLQAGVKATPETEDMYKRAAARAAVGMATGAAGEVVATKLGEQLAKVGDLAESRRILVGIADKYGLKLTPGEITGNPVLKGADRLFTYMPLTAGQVKAINSTNETKIAETVLKAMGSEGKEINERVLGVAKEGLKDRYDDVLIGTVVKLDRKLQKDLLNVADQNFITTTFQGTKANRLIDLIKGIEGNITGKEYNEMRSIIGNYAANTTDDNVARIIHQIQNVVDDAAERTIRPETAVGGAVKKARQEIIDNLQALRKQYTVYNDIFEAAKHKGLTPDGGLSISKLYDAINRRRPGVFLAQKPGREMLPTEELAYLQKIKGEPVQASTLAKSVPYALGFGGVGSGMLSGPAVLGGLGGLRGAQAALYSEPTKQLLTQGVSPTAQAISPELARALTLGVGLPVAGKVGQ